MYFVVQFSFDNPACKFRVFYLPKFHVIINNSFLLFYVRGLCYVLGHRENKAINFVVKNQQQFTI